MPMNEQVLWGLTHLQSIIAQTQKTGILQVAESEKDACGFNSKLSTPPSPLPYTHHH